MEEKKKNKMKEERERKGGYLSKCMMGIAARTGTGRDGTARRPVPWRYRDTFISQDLKPRYRVRLYILEA